MSAKPSEARARAELRFKFESPEKAELALRAIKPDNQPLPRGLGLWMERSEEVILVRVESERTVSSLLVTLDDILSMILLALRAARVAEPWMPGRPDNPPARH